MRLTDHEQRKLYQEYSKRLDQLTERRMIAIRMRLEIFYVSARNVALR